MDKSRLYQKGVMRMDQNMRELLDDTTIEDLPEGCQPIVEIVGMELFFELSEYAQGDALYIPKPESIVTPARNRKIKKEWNGYNIRELADKYGLTPNRIRSILKDEQVFGQLSMFDPDFELYEG